MAKKKTQMPQSSVSPTATGPAGPLFEGQVGAHYLLALLAGDARGVPGVVVDRVEFQRAGEGRALDDVVVHGHDATGTDVVLELQAKREITFAPKDEVFKEVAGQIANAAQRQDFWATRYELAIATAKASLKIAGSYQDLLRRARDVESAALFMERLRRPGAATDDMRTFVETFRGHLREAGAAHDDETVWKLLRRLQILVFDFTAPGSADELLVRTRCVHALHSEEAARGGALWTTLVQRAMQLGASGGADTVESLTRFLQEEPYRLSGQRRFAMARTLLAAASVAALADINDVIAGVSLARQERVEQVRAALAQTRCVDIRGDAGVGKSGLLKHFALLVGVEGPAVVLSPGRTIPRGWLAMGAALRLEGSAEDLLSDLASTGARFVFIDNLDLFDENERPTVTDVLRAAAKVPGLSVIVTARRGFGVDEPSWLPADAIAQLGGTTTVSLDELTASEVMELRHGAPQLAPLLVETHPARQVARNLYRLFRLAATAAGTAAPHTEVEMMDEWWRSADGALDGRRDRNQVLKGAAEHALTALAPFDAGALPPAAVDALVASETLRDLGNGRVSFRHDVLAEWAMASLLATDDAAFNRLPLDRPAHARHARALELVARRLLESGTDVTHWRALLERVSRPGSHGSWRRAVLLALVRSEAAPQLLNMASGTLLADDGRLLRELIGTMRAVEVMPMSQLLEAMGVDPSQAAPLPAHINTPVAPAWMRLMMWLLAKNEALPGPVVPDVADLYWDWSIGMLGQDPLTPLLLGVGYKWLLEIEKASDLRREGPTKFDGGLGGRNFTDVARGLRWYLVLFCHRAPQLAAAYLSDVRQRPHNDRIASQLLKQPGQLPKAAPAELAELTASVLIESRRPRGHERPTDDGFTFVDHEFLPPSPAQGPFLELLRNAPRDGLALIRRLLDHAVAVATDGRDPGTNGFTLPFPEGDRFFPWVGSYGWSRGGARSYAVVSALMALEAWAHERVEAGEPMGVVLADVLGAPGAPVAYLLIAVDLLLSHWPASREAAVPFLACPELLCIDRDRHSNDTQPRPDPFGLGGLAREPKGSVTLATLKERTSRRFPLERLLPQYISSDAESERQRLTDSLLQAKERLGPYSDTATFGDPEFMVVHALNAVNPANYVEEQIPLADGSSVAGFRYVQPEEERLHIEGLQRAQSERTSDFAMKLSILNALEDRTKSSPELAAAAVTWAQAQVPGGPKEEEEEGASEMREQAILTSALLAMRDGTPELRTAQREWAETQFVATLAAKDDAVHRFRPGLRYNPVGVAFTGRVFALSTPPTAEEVTLLLQMTARPAAAHGFAAALSRLNELDARFPRAMVRCALASCVRLRRQWDISDEEEAARMQEQEDARGRAVAAEIDWLFNGAPEPSWPDPPQEKPTRRQHSRRFVEIDEDTVDEPQDADSFFDDQCGALWLHAIGDIASGEATPWIIAMLEALAPWTWRANGAGLRPDEEPSDRSHEWNGAYFDLESQLLPARSREDIETSVIATMCELPDERFLDVATTFLRAVDDAYFNKRNIDDALAVDIRTRLARRLMTTRGWRRMAGDASTSIELHLGPAVGTMFFNAASGFQPPKAYLYAPGVKRLGPFLPILEELATDGPSYHVASLMLNLFEVAPAAEQLPALIRAASAWYAAFPQENELWVEHGIGQRFCRLVEATRGEAGDLLDAGQPLRTSLDHVLAGLVSLGVAAAARLERALAKPRT